MEELIMFGAKATKGLEEFQKAIYELEQMITQGDVECDYIRNEIARNNGKITEDIEDRFYVAKAKAVYNYIKTVRQ
jgi:hypothetical protein